MKSEERIRQEIKILENQRIKGNHFGDIICDRIIMLEWVLKDE